RMRQVFILSLLISVALCTATKLSYIERHQSAVAPAASKVLRSRNSRSCAMECALAADCFGFSWLEGLCRLFSWSAFVSQPWQSSGLCDLYIRKIERLQFVGCEQSSYSSNCGRAIDGNRNQSFSGISCTQTTNNLPEWWEGQLAAPSLISYVTIYNRQGCCPERLNKFSLQVDGVECNQVNLAAPFSVANFTCNAFGSKIRVVNQHDYLTICELEAYN
ncbi:hypothetical protein BOX15_Mlig024493g1, partial [Macrostomum lignano]